MDENEKKLLRSRAMYAFLTIAAVAVFALILFSIENIWAFLAQIISSLTALTIGLSLAYLLSPILNFFENRVFYKIGKRGVISKRRRALSLSLTYIILIGFLYAFFMVVVPNVSDNFGVFQEKYGSFDKIIASIHSIFSKSTLLAGFEEKVVGYLEENREAILNFFYGLILPLIEKYALSVANAALYIIAGFVYSGYALANKEKMVALTKKLMTALFREKTNKRIRKFASLVDINFGKYLRGKIIDSIIVGIVSAIVYALFGFKFYPVLAIIAAVTNMIPFFGPFLGAVPAGFIVLIAQPNKVILLFLIILVLQQLDGNILDPMIVGGQVGLIPIFTMSSTILFGGIFGIPGMLLGVPIFASVYTLIGEFLRDKLKAKSLPTATADYYDSIEELPHVAENSAVEKGDNK